MKPDTWCVAYWSVKVQRSVIIKFGTEADIARLPPAKWRNKTRTQCDRMNSEGREVKRRRTRKNPPPLIVDAALTPAIIPQESDTGITPVTETILDAALSPAIITQEVEEVVEPQRPVIQRARSRTNPVHQLMQRRKSTRNTKKTKSKQNQPSNDFANAFKDIPVQFVRRARESSAPPPPPPPRQRFVLPGMCGGCKNAVSNIHTCDICKHNMHVFCGLPIGEEGYDQKIRCVPCQQALGD